MIKKSNNGVQRTRHKVSGPLTPDVGVKEKLYTPGAMVIVRI